MLDAIRKAIKISADLAERHGLTLWRQVEFNLNQFKRLYRATQKKAHTKRRDSQDGVLAVEERKAEAHESYLKRAQELIAKVEMTLSLVDVADPVDTLQISDIERFLAHAERQIDQITRRVLHGLRIPHQEKVFSLFQEHTEWIVKGKAGVPFELGVMVAIVEDQHGFILHHQVMEKQSDSQIAIQIIKDTQDRFPSFKVCSFDKGFHSSDNQKELGKLLNLCVLPKKGKLNQAEKARESHPDFIAARCRHSAVESGINALQVHGLKKCRDNGIHGFKRYVALAVVARNIQKLGAELMKKAKAETERIRKRAA